MFCPIIGAVVSLGNCPAVSPLTASQCAGAASSCWSPGQADTGKQCQDWSSKLNIFKMHMHSNFYTQIAPTLVCAVLMDVSTPASTVPARRVSASLLLTKSIMENRSWVDISFYLLTKHMFWAVGLVGNSVVAAAPLVAPSPVDKAYSFTYASDDSYRTETSDLSGNVNGEYQVGSLALLFHPSS